MSSEDIYKTYLKYARKSDDILTQYEELAQVTNVSIPKLELTYLHRNIKFILKKLIGLLSNKNLWTRFSQPCSPYTYNATAAEAFNVRCEVKFLEENGEEIVKQLECIINPTVFEIDLKFLHNCYQKLEKWFERLQSRASGQIIERAYQIAS